VSRSVLDDGRQVDTEAAAVVEDVRSSRPYLLSPSSFRAFLRRAVSTAVLATIDIVGLILGLYAALALRAALFEPKPVLWGLLWTNETSWLAFLILLLILVFWQARLYAPREVRERPGRVVPSVFLVAALSLAFAIGTGQRFTTFGLYVVGAVFVATIIGLLRSSYETITGFALSAVGVRRRAVIVGDAGQRAHLRSSLGARRGGIYYVFVDEIEPGGEVEQVLAAEPLDELIVADAGLSEVRLLEIVDAAHRRGVKVRIAPRATELLIERGEYVPGQGVPLFEVRPPIFAGADWVTKRVFDLVVAVLIVLVMSPFWLLIALAIKLTSRGPVFFADERIGLGERPFRLFKFRTMVQGAESGKVALEGANEASGALFKIRDDPRVTPIGRLLRRYSVDEVPNVLNVLRGEMSLIGPRPLPVRDYVLLEPWHRRRYNVLPGMTGLWQVAGRSDLSFDDLVRLDFYYLENWSIWLDLSILAKTPVAVFSRRGAY
jgi:exopolysaccharide biosynthesis polyprenyl glycosylphosphotransferase